MQNVRDESSIVDSPAFLCHPMKKEEGQNDNGRVGKNRQVMRI